MNGINDGNDLNSFLYLVSRIEYSESVLLNPKFEMNDINDLNDISGS